MRDIDDSLRTVEVARFCRNIVIVIVTLPGVMAKL